MKQVFNRVYQCIMILCKIFLIIEILIAALVVVTRYLPGIVVPTWSEETILTCMIYMAMLSAALGLRRNAHIRMTVFDRLLPKATVKALDLFRLCGRAGICPGNGVLWLEFCRHHGNERGICKHALYLQVLAIFPNPAVRACDGPV